MPLLYFDIHPATQSPNHPITHPKKKDDGMIERASNSKKQKEKQKQKQKSIR